jgi:uncharacterized protein with PQ loop repeat
VWIVKPAKSKNAETIIAAMVNLVLIACCTHWLIEGFLILLIQVKFAAIATRRTSPVRIPPSFIAA